MFQRVRDVLKKALPQKSIDLLYDWSCRLFAMAYRLRQPSVIVRTGTSDAAMLYEVMAAGEYDFPLPESPTVIVDVGANVGYTTLFLADKFPHAKIFAVEPEASNFAVLEKNTANLPLVTRLRRGVWSKAAHLKITETAFGHCGFVTDEVAEGEPYDIDAMTVGDLHALAGGGVIDILKIDVEGAEKEIFSADCDAWLGAVKVLLIELHDRMRPGCSEAFDAAIAKYPHTRVKKLDTTCVTFQR